MVELSWLNDTSTSDLSFFQFQTILEGYCTYDGVILAKSSTSNALICQQDCASYNGKMR